MSPCLHGYHTSRFYRRASGLITVAQKVEQAAGYSRGSRGETILIGRLGAMGCRRNTVADARRRPPTVGMLGEAWPGSRLLRGRQRGGTRPDKTKNGNDDQGCTTVQHKRVSTHTHRDTHAHTQTAIIAITVITAITATTATTAITAITAGSPSHVRLELAPTVGVLVIQAKRSQALKSRVSVRTASLC